MISGTIEKQIEIEEEAQEASINKYINSFYKDMNNGNLIDTAEGQVFVKLGFTAIVAKIQEFIDTKTTGTRNKDKNELLNLCDDPKVLAYITLSTILPLIISKNNRPSLIIISKRIMNHLYNEQGIALLRENDPKMFKYMDTQYKRASKSRKAELIKTHVANMRERADISSLVSTVNEANMARIGAHLIDCLINSGVGLFTKGKVYNGRKQGFTYVISMTKEGREVITVAHSEVLRRLSFTAAPMIVPPIPWTTNYDGGMYTKRVSIMKMKTPEGFKELKAQPLHKVYPVLNKLQNTKWRINTFVVDTISTIFNNNMIDPQSPRKLQRLYGGLPTSDIVDPKDIIIKDRYGIVDDDGMFKNKADFVRWRRDLESVTISLDGEMGRRLQIIAAIGEATRFRDYLELYFSYVLDSRGRVYTQQAVITPQGSAEIKAMLEFGEGELLTERGEYWFKIHTANVYGKDKEEFNGRLNWFDTNITHIRAIGSSPLEHLDKWVYADSPFEFLAACKAWVDHEAGLPVHVPIQLDCTNSGVQIYSGLLGDLDGAKTVNVINNDECTRADVYQIVADKVNESLLSENYPKMFEARMSDGNTKMQSTYKEAKSITPTVTIVDVPDTYILKEGEEWHD